MHRCCLSPGQRGICLARKNSDGRIVCDNYGMVTSLALDPIEKKPLKMFRPGSLVLSVGSFGCNLKCPFCDTQHSSGREMSDEEIIKEVCFYPTRFVVLTGGEPGLQVDREFINKLHQAGKFVQIETNGTVPLPIGIDWITCSPKEGSKVIVVNPHEIKVVYTGQDLSTYEAMTAAVYYLQPCSCQNTEEVINYVKEHPKWKLSLQTQKILNVQ